MNTIFHVDVNSAFLSWSALKKLQEDPGSVDLRTVPSAVGGDVHTRHGIITAKYRIQKQTGIKVRFHFGCSAFSLILART